MENACNLLAKENSEDVCCVVRIKAIFIFKFDVNKMRRINQGIARSLQTKAAYHYVEKFK